MADEQQKQNQRVRNDTDTLLDSQGPITVFIAVFSL